MICAVVGKAAAALRELPVKYMWQDIFVEKAANFFFFLLINSRKFQIAKHHNEQLKKIIAKLFCV